jgi:C4-dicarboxylate-specific signal transduction histidine kinase
MLTQMSGRILEIGAARSAERETVALRPVVNDAYASLCRDLAKDGIRFTAEVDDMITVHADALQLQQVLFNLFLNAREAMAKDRNGRLSVSAVCQGQYVILVVRNTGPAIPADLLEHIFEPFSTSKPSERNGRQRCGGLGLALCKDLVEENEGTIHVTSDASTGTTFTITLPAAKN